MKVIINADDFGLSTEVNRAITYCFGKGYISQTTIMVNMPYADEAAEIAKKNGFYDKVGIHINLVQGQPLTEKIKKTSLCNDSGEFNNALMKGTKRFVLTSEEKKAVAIEIQAQIERYLNYGFPLKHIDSHRHAHTNMSVLKILIPIAKNNGFKSMRLSRNLLSKNKASVLKKIYKKRVNALIMRFNGECGPNGFGTMPDFSTRYRNAKLVDIDSTDYIEIMTHPVYRENELVDAINSISVEKWYQSFFI